MRQDLSKNWEILQDVHDTCEQLGLPEHEEFMTCRDRRFQNGSRCRS